MTEVEDWHLVELTGELTDELHRATTPHDVGEGTFFVLGGVGAGDRNFLIRRTYDEPPRYCGYALTSSMGGIVLDTLEISADPRQVYLGTYPHLVMGLSTLAIQSATKRTEARLRPAALEWIALGVKQGFNTR